MFSKKSCRFRYNKANKMTTTQHIHPQKQCSKKAQQQQQKKISKIIPNFATSKEAIFFTFDKAA